MFPEPWSRSVTRFAYSNNQVWNGTQALIVYIKESRRDGLLAFFYSLILGILGNLDTLGISHLGILGIRVENAGDMVILMKLLWF